MKKLYKRKIKISNIAEYSLFEVIKMLQTKFKGTCLGKVIAHMEGGIQEEFTEFDDGIVYVEVQDEVPFEEIGGESADEGNYMLGIYGAIKEVHPDISVSTKL